MVLFCRGQPSLGFYGLRRWGSRLILAHRHTPAIIYDVGDVDACALGGVEPAECHLVGGVFELEIEVYLQLAGSKSCGHLESLWALAVNRDLDLGDIIAVGTCHMAVDYDAREVAFCAEALMQGLADMLSADHGKAWKTLLEAHRFGLLA